MCCQQQAIVPDPRLRVGGPAHSLHCWAKRGLESRGTQPNKAARASGRDTDRCGVSGMGGRVTFHKGPHHGPRRRHSGPRQQASPCGPGLML